MHVLLLALAVPDTLGSDWPTARGPAEGTYATAGAGDITGTTGGFPIYGWTTSYSTTSYNVGYSAVFDASGDGSPETLGVTRGRVYQWDASGAVLAVSDSMATPAIHGIYDLDGDGLEQELVVVGSGVGGGVFIYDATTLARLWRSSDPGLNGGGSIAETAMVDTDGDSVPELLWSSSFTGYADYRLVSFESGFGAPVEVVFALPSTSSGLLPPVSGAYYGVPGGFAVEQGQVVTMIEATDRTATGAVCSTDESRCLRLVGQYTGVHASFTVGDRLSFDADGDGDSEYLSTSVNDLGAIDLTVLDPSAGATTDEAVAWQYRYGNGAGVPIDRFVYAPGGQGFASSAGGRAVVATVYNDEATETNRAGVPIDDCASAADEYAVIAFDAVTGTPLANLYGTRAYGVVDADADGVPEILTVDDDTSAIEGWELVCEGPGITGAWSSCADTGCTLEQAWAVSGDLPLLLPQQIDPSAWHVVEASTAATPDLDGDGAPEILVSDDGDLVAFHIEPDGTATVAGRYPLGACSTVGGWTGTGADTWILLEGVGCHTVLDATLTPLSAPNLVDDNQGVGLALVGDVGHSVIALANRIYADPSSTAAMAAPTETLGETPVRFADLDGDGIDELITYAQTLTAGWRVVVYDWTGLAYTQRWRVTSTDVEALDRSITIAYAPYQFTTGDFNGDGQDDVALLAVDPTRGAAAFPERGTLLYLDGVDGSLINRQVAPPTGQSATYAEPMQAADLCAGTTCPGTDGIDEVVLIGATSVSWFSPSAGYLLGWSIDTSSEALWGDFDGDGEPELAVAAGFSQTNGYRVQVMELDGTLSWEVIPGSASGIPYTMHAAADIDADGALDIVVGGGYGEITAYSGVDGALLSGFPVYLDAGLAETERHENMRRVLQILLGDIDGDGNVEAVVAHDDGYLYAVNVSPAEGLPSLAWALYIGSPVSSVRAIDADDDGTLELLVLANDGRAQLIDGGEVTVDITAPEDGACTSEASLEISGTAEEAAEVEVYLQGVPLGRVAVTDSAWSTFVTWPSEGEFRVEAWAVVDDALVASDTITVTYFDDADADGVSECNVDCDDNDPARYPGAEELCDGVDADCDGAISDESDDDGDGYLACEECDDAHAEAFPGGVEVCDELDNDCDEEVDDNLDCNSILYHRGGGGFGCISAGTTPLLPTALLLALGLCGVRRRRA